jgi:hypothetical protein
MARGGRRTTSWSKGVSGNPSGRPKNRATIEARQIIHDVKEAAKALTFKAIATLRGSWTTRKRRQRRAQGRQWRFWIGDGASRKWM